MQEGPQKERQVLPHGRSKGNEHDWQQLVRLVLFFPVSGWTIPHNHYRIHKTKYNDDGNDKDKNKNKARSKSRTRTMFGRKSGS